jgi:exonuclease III
LALHPSLNSMTIKIATYNVRGLGNNNKREQIFQWLKTQSFSVCLLQETHSTQNVINNWKHQWGGDIFLSGNSSNSEGIAILINSNCSYKIHKYQDIIQGRLQVLDIEINDKLLTIVNIYGSNKDDVYILEKHEKFLEDNEESNIIIGGDFNTVLSVLQDKKNSSNDTHKNCRIKLLTLLNTFNLIDIWRIQHPDKGKFTWHSNNKPPIFCRLDYFLISEHLQNCIEKSDIKASYKSDHCLVSMNLNLNTVAKGPGFFKLNNSLLLDKDYQTNIKNNINIITEINKDSNPNVIWELIKGTVRNESIKYATMKKKKQNQKENELNKTIEKLEEKICFSTDIDTKLEATQELLETKQELDDILDYKLKGTILRSKAESVEFNEKNSKYFANLEKRNAEKKIISQLTINGNITSDQNKIRVEQKSFYQNLYKIRHCQIDSYDFFNNSTNKLNQSETEKCEGFLTEYECKQALFYMKNGKSPGSDGLTTEFYKIFWKDIGTYLVKSLNYSHKQGQLTELQTQSVITLLPKSGKDSTLLENWRPISLLNTDYKIATKAIANRLKHVLNSIIGSDQTGFIKGRYIGENIRLLCETLEYVDTHDIPSILFFADFEKAFDSLDHEYMFKVLIHFNFGESLISWIKLFYKGAKSSIISNGHLTDFFDVQRGVRQGCPLSPYLFIICIELLSNSISKNDKIKGINMSGLEFKQTLFADDGTFITDGSRRSFETLIQTLDNFSLVSGLKLNTKKCNVLRAGLLKKSHITFMKEKHFNWNSENIKTLGITFSSNVENIVLKNLEPKLSDFTNCLKSWEHRKLSLMGKITVIKTFALPKLIYPLTVLPNPPLETINIIKRKMFEFLWNKKGDKIKREVITKKYEQGGLKMIDINTFISALKSSWIKRIYDENNTGKWKQIYLNTLNKNGGKLILECNLHENDINQIFKDNTFLKQVLISWNNFRKLETNIQTSHEIIWNNTYIKVGSKTVFYKQWYDHGIKYLNQIYDFRSKNFLSFKELKKIFDIPNNDILKYNQLVSSIPTTWKKTIKYETTQVANIESLLIRVLKVSKPTKFLYNYEQKLKASVDITAQTKWYTIMEEDSFEWKSIYVLSFKSTIDQKLRTFQYKYLMRIIRTNDFLLKCNMVSSNLCDFCQMYVETPEHLFWECMNTQIFWTELTKFLISKNIQVLLTYKLVSFGLLGNNLHSEQINFILIYAKYFIYMCKIKTLTPSILHFQHKLQNEIEIEKQIALNHDKLEYYESKWTQFI